MNALFLSRIVVATSLLFITVAFPVMAYAIDRNATTQAPIEVRPEGGEVGFVEPKPGHGQHHPRGGWYLGVYGNYSDTGLLLTNVYPGTPAARVGLEVGDCIVAVNGHQIGVIVNRRLNLDVALQHYSSQSGRVRLLIQDRRTKQLLNIDVQLVRGRVYT